VGGKLALKFGRDWNRAIQAYGITRFHMTDYENRRDEFKDRPRSARMVRRLQRLHNIINDTIVMGYWVTVDLSAYDLLSEDEKRWSMDPYRIAVVTLLARMSKRLNEVGRKPADRIAYVLDRIDKGHGELKEVFDQLAVDQDWDAYRLGSMTWAKSVNVPHLQAADIIAYEMAKKVTTELGRGVDKYRQSLLNLTRGPAAKKYGGIHIGPGNLRELLKERA